MSSAYINQLNTMVTLERAAPAPQSPDLCQRFLAWYESLPEVSRHRPFAMIELEQALDTQGKYLSPVLLGLGWQRHRKWSSKTQYHRYWVPPTSV